MRRILLKTMVLVFPVLTLLSLHLLMPPDTAAQVRSRRSITPRPRRATVRRNKSRDAVFIGGGASTGAIIGRKRRQSIIAGGAGVGARAQRRSSITGGALGAGVGGRKRRINSAIGAGGAGTYRNSRRQRRRN